MPTREEISTRIDTLIGQDSFPELLIPAYLSQAMTAYPGSGGKRLRPALLVWCCEAAGGTLEHAWDAAVAVELYHNWTLIHDDIIDDDDVRRGMPTCHISLGATGKTSFGGDSHRQTAFGSNMAILAGDVLHGWSIDCLSRSVDRGVPASVVNMLVRRMCGWLTPQLIGGEALDVEFELRATVPPGEIRQMMFLKTGALLQFCAETGVMIGKGTGDLSDPQVAHAGKFAGLAGVAFQIQDDILGIYADEEKLGKPVGSDISEGKHTLLIARALELANAAQKAVLKAVLGCGRLLSPEELQNCRRVIEECGAREGLAQEARDTATAAGRHLTEAFPASAVRGQLEEWLAYLTERTF